MPLRDKMRVPLCSSASAECGFASRNAIARVRNGVISLCFGMAYSRAWSYSSSTSFMAPMPSNRFARICAGSPSSGTGLIRCLSGDPRSAGSPTATAWVAPTSTSARSGTGVYTPTYILIDGHAHRPGRGDGGACRAPPRKRLHQVSPRGPWMHPASSRLCATEVALRNGIGHPWERIRLVLPVLPDLSCIHGHCTRHPM